ncbi:MAG: glucose-1-phosphate adenylyltransferase subunit GlgD [Clostridia bacterium]|nr:glucose-1-phosphate adenylyltransferase subunit GlgD [Clostridia bacterium]
MNALGIIFSNIHDSNVPELTSNRTMAAIPFGGRYRLIDFVLSSMVNSGITHVGCITNRNYRSLMDHVGSGKEWDLARKNGGFVLLPPFGEIDSTSLYSTRLEALKTVLGFITRSNEEYIILADANSVFNINFNDLLKHHVAVGAEITLLYVNKPASEISGTNNAILKMDGEGIIKELAIDPRMNGRVNIYGNIVVMKRNMLVSLVSDAIAHGRKHFLNDVIGKNVSRHRVAAYEHKGYYQEISSLKRYYDANLGLLDPATRQALFGTAEIYTQIKDSAPTKYGDNAIVKNSLISDGCVIEGEVYNSVLSRGVKISRGTVVRNCILMKGTITGENVSLNAVIADKGVVIRDRRCLSGADNFPIYIPKETVV